MNPLPLLSGCLGNVGLNFACTYFSVKLLRLSNEQECYDDIYECVEVSVNTEQGCYHDMSGEVEELYDNVVGDIDRNISPQQQEAITGESYVKPITEDYCAPPAIGTNCKILSVFSVDEVSFWFYIQGVWRSIPLIYRYLLWFCSTSYQ